MAQAPAQQPGVMNQAMDPLAQLRDIHQPAMIETWPPAIGWWILAGLAAAALLLALISAYRRWRANRYRREAIQELNSLLDDWRSHQDDGVYLTSLQLLLKRVALTRFPRDEVASLTGEAWVQFLDRSSGSHDFSMGEMEVLIDGNYRQDISINVESLQTFAAQWIRQHDSRFLEAVPA